MGIKADKRRPIAKSFATNGNDIKVYTQEQVEGLEELFFDEKKKNDEEAFRRLLDLLHSDKTPIYDDKKTMPLNNVIRCENLPDCTLANVVCTYSLGAMFNLKKMAYLLKSVLQCQFNPLSFAAMSLIIRTEWLPTTTVLIFSSSNTVHTGPRSEEHARQSGWALTYYLNKFLGIPAILKDFKIRNIVSNFRLGYKVNLAGLAQDLGSRASFVPDKIHSCRIRCLKDSNRVCLMYPSGSGVLTGMKTRDEIVEFYKESGENCKRFRCEGVTSKNEYRYSKKQKEFDTQILDTVNKKLQQIDPNITDSSQIQDPGTYTFNVDDTNTKNKKKEDSIIAMAIQEALKIPFSP